MTRGLSIVRALTLRTDSERMLLAITVRCPAVVRTRSRHDCEAPRQPRHLLRRSTQKAAIDRRPLATARRRDSALRGRVRDDWATRGLSLVSAGGAAGLNEQAQSKEGGEYTGNGDLRIVHGTPLRGLDYLGRAKASLRAEKRAGRRACAAGGGHVPARAKERFERLIGPTLSFVNVRCVPIRRCTQRNQHRRFFALGGDRLSGQTRWL